MAGGPGTGLAGQGAGGGGDLDQAITVLRARVDEEFKITERLDTKGRQAFALASLFFGVVQTVAFGSFAAGSIHGAEKFLLLVGVVLAGVALLVVAHRLTNGEQLQEEEDIKPEAIERWCNEAGTDPEYIRAHLVGELRRVARERSDNNIIRGRNYNAVANATRWSLILSIIELLAAITVRL